MFKFLSSRAALAATLLIVLQGAMIYSAVRPESPPSGRGTAVVLTLPLSEEAAVAETPAARAAAS